MRSPIKLLLLISLSLLALPSTSSAAGDIRFGIESNNQVFTSMESALEGGFFELYVTGGIESRIVVEFVDLLTDASGNKRAVPLGATPFSPASYVKLEEFERSYRPSPDIQRFLIPFSFQNIENLSRPILGGLKILIVPKKETEKALNLASAIVGTFAYYPEGFSRDLESGIEPQIDLLDIRVSDVSKETFPFSMLPDLSWIFESGPLAVDVKTKNEGNIFLNSQTSVEVDEVRFLGESKTSGRFKFESKENLLLPNQVLDSTLLLQNVGQKGRLKDPFSGIGIYRITSKVVGFIGTEKLAGDLDTRTIVIFPWKHFLVFFLFLVTFRRRLISLLFSLKKLALDFMAYREQDKKSYDEVLREIESWSVAQPEETPPTKTMKIKKKPAAESRRQKSASKSKVNKNSIQRSTNRKLSSKTMTPTPKKKAVRKTTS